MSEMTRSQRRRLEIHRVSPSDKSLKLQQELKDYIISIRKDFKENFDTEITGVSFFGSRIVGNEYAMSDQDIFLFYDGSHLKPAPTSKWKLGRLIESYRQFKDEVEFENTVSRSVARKMGRLGLPVEKRSGGQIADKTILYIDISEREVEKHIQKFIADYEKYPTDRDKAKRKMSQVIVSYFCPGAGPGIYKARRQVLDFFGHHPRGTEYFQMLLNLLSEAERGDIRKNFFGPRKRTGLPQITWPLERRNGNFSLEDGRRYFLAHEAAQKDWLETASNP